MLKQVLSLAEKGYLPDALIRFGIRRLLKKRLEEISHKDAEKSQALKSDFFKSMDQSPIALVPHLANKQHYEVPSTFFDFCLGKHKKYSSCYWDKDTKNLDDAEWNALKISAVHHPRHHASLVGSACFYLAMGCARGQQHGPHQFKL